METCPPTVHSPVSTTSTAICTLALWLSVRLVRISHCDGHGRPWWGRRTKMDAPSQLLLLRHLQPAAGIWESRSSPAVALCVCRRPEVSSRRPLLMPQGGEVRNSVKQEPRGTRAKWPAHSHCSNAATLGENGDGQLIDSVDKHFLNLGNQRNNNRTLLATRKKLWKNVGYMYCNTALTMHPYLVAQWATWHTYKCCWTLVTAVVQTWTHSYEDKALLLRRVSEFESNFPF